MDPSFLMHRIEVGEFEKLVTVLQEVCGYQVFGPTLRDRAIVYDRITSAEDLPKGWTEICDAGTYRVTMRPDRAYFGYTVGPHAWKQVLFPAQERLWRATQKPSSANPSRERSHGNNLNTIVVENEPLPQAKMAFLGVRSCDLHAIAIQDHIFLRQHVADPRYASRRDNTLLIAIQCTDSTATCFCAAMGTGPQSRSGFDISLTEIIEKNGAHYFLVAAGSSIGSTVLGHLTLRPAHDAEINLAQEQIHAAEKKMTRSLPTAQVKTILYENTEHPAWEQVAERCLSCGNCTSVCPTCFCSNVSEIADLEGKTSERWRKWDSCFSLDHSYLHGGYVRSSVKSRYRQWLTHKLASWQDQFGTSGCVGCGRCIAWCPVGIDLTAEVAKLAHPLKSPHQEAS